MLAAVVTLAAFVGAGDPGSFRGILALLLVIVSWPGYGLLAVERYTKKHSVTLTIKQGAVLGLYTGIFGGVVSAIFGEILYMMGFGRDVFEANEGFGDFFTALFVGALLGAVCGLVGGALGSVIWKKGEDPDDL